MIEIVSPESRERDRVEKFYEYERGGVREYWILDPEEKRAEFYRLGEDGKYLAIAAGEDGIFRSTVLEGFWIQVDWLFQEPKPPFLSILKEWKIL